MQIPSHERARREGLASCMLGLASAAFTPACADRDAQPTTTSPEVPANASEASPSPPGEPCPDFPGWKRWSPWKGDEAASLCIPSAGEAWPEPIRWEPCDARAGLTTGCEQMKVTWTAGDEPIPVTPAVSISADAGGPVLLQLVRNASRSAHPHRIALVAEADGPVRSAILMPWRQDAALLQSSDSNGLRGGRAVLRVVGARTGSSTFREVVLDAAPGETAPRSLQEWPDSRGHEIATSEALWATSDGHSIGVGGYDGTPWHVVSAPSLQQVDPIAVGDVVFWRDSDAKHASRVLSWRRERGVRPLIDFADDGTSAVYGFGTDGEHLAWVRFEGKSPSCAYDPEDCPYDRASLMVAPFTHDTPEPTRLRPWPSRRLPVRPLAVGCGHVAYGYAPGKTLIVRIADGAAAELPSGSCSPPDVSGDWCFEHVFGLTCEHAYVRGGVGTASTVVRVDLESIGLARPPG